MIESPEVPQVLAFGARVRYKQQRAILDVVEVQGDVVHTVAPDGSEAAYSRQDVTPVT